MASSLIKYFGMGTLGGSTLRNWLRVLWDNGCAVDPVYWGRAGLISLASIPNSAFAGLERVVHGRAVRATNVDPPIFILGIWRSGTTHLHNLLARDARFAYPNLYQVCYPNTFLVTERLSSSIFGALLPSKRAQDNVAMGAAEPQEDEFALFGMTGRSAMLSWSFPRRADHFDRYLTLRGLSDRELVEWKSALHSFVQKLSYRYRRPLVLKSPGHTARIKVLLEMFPDARFVHIHRNPFDVFQSTKHMLKTVTPWFALQRAREAEFDDRIIRQYAEAYEAFFEERRLVPAGRFHEVQFETLEANPVDEVRKTYAALSLPDFSVAEPAVRQYVDSLTGYKKNSYTNLPSDLKQRIVRDWARSFAEWGYET